jgi:hypothetical protein
MHTRDIGLNIGLAASNNNVSYCERKLEHGYLMSRKLHLNNIK